MTTEREPSTEAGRAHAAYLRSLNLTNRGYDTWPESSVLAIEGEAAREALERVRRAVKELPMYQNAGAGVTTNETTTRRLREYRAAVLRAIEEASR